MLKYLQEDEWKVIEKGFDPDHQKKSESIFSLGNGHMGLRANFEESYSGPTLQGTYLAGIYYPDKTRVGWWKNGYPEYFAKMLNAPSWIGYKLIIDGNLIDLNKLNINSFTRTLDMKQGILLREFEVTLPGNNRVACSVTRFVSMARREIGAIQYRITPLDKEVALDAEMFLQGDVYNQDSNYDEKFWEDIEVGHQGELLHLAAMTKKSRFRVNCCMATLALDATGERLPVREFRQTTELGGHRYLLSVNRGETVTLTKIVSVTTSRDHDPGQLREISANLLLQAFSAGFDTLLKEHTNAWAQKWDLCDIRIGGDIAAQQGIRFNIFHLCQTYTGHDPRLNIGPKGFTGEKYGGSTYWDTEAFCLPFYLGTAKPEVARNLLLYRYNQLTKAIENASRLGFSGGAALYPMVTVNGEECHNEWEITFEEIHRNGAIAFAIYNYIRHTGDRRYLADYGLEVLIGISRFWSQRVTFSDVKQKFVLLGVTGPNEYENNVNNNWYTNYIAVWTLAYTIDGISWMKTDHPDLFTRLADKTGFHPDTEILRWDSIIRNMYLPESKELGIYLQQEGYLDKEQRITADLKPEDLPLNQRWSWDRILRSCFIKQADVLQGFYFFEDHFDTENLRRNFDFYEPRTVHESSLSASIHSVLAARLGDTEKAYELYLRTSRLDLDDYNHEVEQGCHITSMAGTWIAIVEGFAGMKVVDGHLSFNPVLPDGWTEVSIIIHFRDTRLQLTYNADRVSLQLLDGTESEVKIGKRKYKAIKGQTLSVQL
jgi:maltose phosphorylase